MLIIKNVIFTGCKHPKNSYLVSKTKLLVRSVACAHRSEREWVRGHSVANLSSLSIAQSASVNDDTCNSLATNLHLLPTLDGLGLIWAFRTSSPSVLVEACVPFLPTFERTQASDSDASTSATFGSAIRAGGGTGNSWTWQNLRCIGVALWLQEEQVRVPFL